MTDDVPNRTSNPKSYTQYVPGQCDRIVWRGSVYMLPLPSNPSPVETSEPRYDATDIRYFLGWLSVKLPELHRIETPRLGDAWEEWRSSWNGSPESTPLVESAQKASTESFEWTFNRYRNGRLMAQGVKVRAATEAEAWNKARELLHIDGNSLSDELYLTENGNGDER